MTVILTDAQARNATPDRRDRRPARACPPTPRRSGSPPRSRSRSSTTSAAATATRSGCSSSARPRAGARAQQILDPVHATNAFYDALERVPGYADLPVTVAAQRVQRSGYPVGVRRLRGGRPGARLGPDRLLAGRVLVPPVGARRLARRRAHARAAAIAPGPARRRSGRPASASAPAGGSEVPVSSRAARAGRVASYVVAHAATARGRERRLPRPRSGPPATTPGGVAAPARHARAVVGRLSDASVRQRIGKGFARSMAYTRSARALR